MSYHETEWVREAVLPQRFGRRRLLLRTWCRLWGWSWRERSYRDGGVIVEMCRRERFRDGRLRSGLWEVVDADRGTGGMLWTISEFHGPLPPRPVRRYLAF